MKGFLTLVIIGLFTSCNPETPITKRPPINTSIKKTETIFVNKPNIKNISLAHPAGKISVINGDVITAKYGKQKWREWCILRHKEESGTLKIEVENTSITGQGGCELQWELTIPSTGNLKLNQAAGSIIGKGSVASLKVQLAAGNLEWKNGTMALGLQVAAGNVDLKNMSFPKTGESLIQVGTGQITITSPKGQNLTTLIDNAIGKQRNDFQKKTGGHTLKLKVAVGKVSHKAI